MAEPLQPSEPRQSAGTSSAAEGADPSRAGRDSPLEVGGAAIEPNETTAAPAVGDRPAALRLARLHLRTGSLALARAELETLAGDGALDDEALLDLAEVRWRTDDLTGAGEAAAASIANGRVTLVALIIAAEATAALGRPAEARRLAGRALELGGGSIDSVFAGMPRSEVWPREATETVAFTSALEQREPTGRPAAGPAAAVAVPMAAGGGQGSPVTPVAEPMPGAPDPGAELAAARAALAAGDRSGAAIRLAVVLRLSPSLAPAVLDIAATEAGPEFDLVRGDALRLVGRETQARRSFAAAARGSGPDGGAPTPLVVEPGSDEADGEATARPGAHADEQSHAHEQGHTEG